MSYRVWPAVTARVTIDGEPVEGVRVTVSDAPPVFRVELPLGLAPTLNVYASMRPWQRAQLRKYLSREFSEALWRNAPRVALLGVVRGPSKRRGMPGPVIDEGQSRRRLVVVTRYSSVMPDETSCDSIGGKAPIDMLVRMGILRDDSPKWCDRTARWERAKPGEGRFVLEVYEIGEHGK